MWRETTKHDRNRRIFDDEFETFLPDKILDFHLHVFNEGVLPPGVAFESGGPAITAYDFDALRQDLNEVYPRRETRAVCFGLPRVDADHQTNNAYLASECDNKRFFALRLLDPGRDSSEPLREDLESRRFVGVKPYPDYARKPNIGDVEIPDMLPDWAMHIVDETHSLVMLHIPRSARLADPLNQQHLVDLCTRYPNARVVLAHIGRAYYLQNVVGRLEALKDLPNLYYDLAMLNHWEVIEYAFRELDPEKILFGSDIPIALAPGKSVEINNQYTYVTPNPWALSISDDHGRLVFTSFLFEELRAIKKAVERLGLNSRFVENLFFTNGMRLLEDVLTEEV